MLFRTIYICLVASLLMTITNSSYSEDTVKVRTIEFSTDRAGWFDFPEPGADTYRKIVMNFKIKCPDGKPCGEWDYISNVYVDHYYAPNYRLNGKSLPKAEFMLDTSWTFKPEQVDGKWVLTKTAKPALLLELYGDDENPTTATETRFVWDTYYTYTMDENGTITDSSLVEPDSTIILTKKRVYFKDDVTIVDRFEIMRYLTPYGNGLNLGEGWLYEIDVTDFLPLLTGRVYIYSPCGGWGNQISNTDQEALQLSFDFIKGTPSRDIIRFEKFQINHYAVYDAKFETLFPAKEIKFEDNEKGAKLRVIQTGHGFGGNQDNCAEFCKKEANVKIDNVQRYARYIWRECGDIPLFPQGGTWVIDRTNWCPGMDAEYHDYELTPFITPGGTHFVDYSMEYYNTPFTTGSNHIPYWVITSYLITYGEPNFALDAEIVDIINPSKKQAYSRVNPSCFNYSFLLKNNGKQKINSIEVRFGFEGDDNYNSFSWNGSLEYLDTATIIIDNFFRNDDFASTRNFYIEIVKVNGVEDDNKANNIAKSLVEPVMFLPKEFTLNLKTNNYANEQYYYIVRDHEWNVLRQRTSFTNNTQYTEEFNLENGCYDFLLQNKLGYGLYIFFVVDQLGRGTFNISSRGKTIQTFNPDFGNYIYRQVRVGEVPEATFSTDTLRFGNVKVDVEAEQIFEISPKNNTPLRVNNINIFLGATYGFRVISTEPELVNNEPITLQPGESLKVKIGYKPKKIGASGANMLVSTNDFYTGDQTVRLLGVGTDPNTVDDFARNNPEMEVSFNSTTMNAKVKIKIDNDILNTNVKLYDSMGSLVKVIYENTSFNGYDEFECNLEGLTSGVYHFVLSNGNSIISKAIAVTK